MGWDDLSADEKNRTLRLAQAMGLTEADLSSRDDLIVGMGGVSLDGRLPGPGRVARLKPTKVAVKNADDLVRLFGHPDVMTSTALAGIKVNERRGLLRSMREIASPEARTYNAEGRALNQVTSALVRRSIQLNELKPDQAKIVNEIAARVIGIIYLLPNVVIEANCSLSFVGSGPHSLIANKITIRPGGCIVGNNATVQISCNTLEIQ